MITTIIDRKPRIEPISANTDVENANKKCVAIITDNLEWTVLLQTRLSPYFILKSLRTSEKNLHCISENQQIDLLILDDELLHICTQPELSVAKNIPIILLTDQELRHEISIKPDLCISKACSGHELIHAIARILGWESIVSTL